MLKVVHLADRPVEGDVQGNSPGLDLPPAVSGRLLWLLLCSPGQDLRHCFTKGPQEQSCLALALKTQMVAVKAAKHLRGPSHG